MTTTALADLGQLADQLRSSAPDADVELTTYSSGGAMLDVRRGGRLFVLAFSPQWGFGVDEVRDGEGLQTSFTHSFAAFQSAADKLLELAAPEGPRSEPLRPALSLIVLYAADIARSKQFYESLGLVFVVEQHGGPEHYACQLDSSVFEIYPRKTAPVGPMPMRLGFQVQSVDETIERLARFGTRLISPTKDSKWGRRAVVEDPDGYAVELTSSSA